MLRDSVIGIDGKHYRFSVNARSRMRAANLGNKNACGKRTPEQCAKIAEGTKLGMSKEVCEQISIGNEKKWEDPDYRKRTCASDSKAMKQRWQNLESARKLVSSWHTTPTQPEILVGRLLNELFAGEFFYNGNGPIVVGGRTPDFVHNNGQNLAIAVNGNYWHKDEDVHKIKRHYAKHGYKLLIIWESELKTNIDHCMSKISKFVRGGSDV
jgi:G:T-mismatch repair DNA endonuclease (very short patch repair protein)